MAREVGISHSSVQRIWNAHALQPHRVQTFKFTTDPDAEDPERVFGRICGWNRSPSPLHGTTVLPRPVPKLGPFERELHTSLPGRMVGTQLRPAHAFFLKYRHSPLGFGVPPNIDLATSDGEASIWTASSYSPLDGRPRFALGSVSFMIPPLQIPSLTGCLLEHNDWTPIARLRYGDAVS